MASTTYQHDLEKTLPDAAINSIPSSRSSSLDPTNKDANPNAIGGDIDPVAEKRLRRKLDFRILPLVSLMYLVAFIDRANIGNARIAGMETDLDLKGYRFNIALTVFYVFYVVVEIPSNLILKRVGPKLYLPGLVGLFGLVSFLTAFCESYAGLIACRAVLGALEGGLMPGITYYLGCYYRRHELFFRVGVFISSASLSGAFGGLLASGLVHVPTFGPVHTWRNIFFFEGIITIVVGAMAWIWLPELPEKTKWLAVEERELAQRRIAVDNMSSSTTTTDEDGEQHVTVWSCVFNSHTWLCALAYFLTAITINSFSLFIPSILRSMGYTAERAQLMTVGPYALACVWSVALAYFSDKTRKRGLWILISMPFIVIGYALLVSVPTSRTSIRYLAVFFAAFGAFPLGPAFLSWASNNVRGRTQRATATALVTTFGNIGAIVATWCYLPGDAPAYRKGHGINLGVAAANILVVAFTVGVVKMKNRRRAGKEESFRLME
ncbi:MFS general substrate transporter [Saitoella complicata NRRL Y-17804]|uniref:MFS general substrate transporter n=1 Tax=Saitoella complicata (strain BCRC 22490 / CBS 7301 / JCM 7358 / NBRC 10748 / NRRL Y-17804) TaxID=698492 RepID=UPI000867DCD4|nr:MFS general substrate transporter [Saitoella complicata NRRL Y-17804]ODQ55156.1 MFS general substrate transporter [Saitoella complicata NRRL Y-17804]